MERFQPFGSYPSRASSFERIASGGEAMFTPETANTGIFARPSLSWPKGNSSNVFLAQALDEVGQVLMPDEWQGDEPFTWATANLKKLLGDVQAVNFDSIAPKLVPSLNYSPSAWAGHIAHNNECDRKATTAERHVLHYREHQRLVSARKRFADFEIALSRVARAMDWIGALGCEEDGRFVTRGRLITGGAFFPLPPYVWNVEHLWANVFARCSVTHRTLDCYVFLDRETLDKQIAKLGPPSAVGKISAVKQTEQWLADQFRDPRTASTAKAVFKEQALSLFGAKLSGEGFKRAWDNASAEFPERSKPGAKAKA
jgi:hypothetical protein